MNINQLLWHAQSETKSHAEKVSMFNWFNPHVHASIHGGTIYNRKSLKIPMKIDDLEEPHFRKPPFLVTRLVYHWLCTGATSPGCSTFPFGFFPGGIWEPKDREVFTSKRRPKAQKHQARDETTKKTWPDWWLSLPLWKILVNWDYYSQYMEK